MSTWAARKLARVVELTQQVLGMEYLAAVQALEFQRPLQTSPALEIAASRLREQVPRLEEDRFMASDIAAAADLVPTLALLAASDAHEALTHRRETRVEASTTPVPPFALFARRALTDCCDLESNNAKGGTLHAEAGSVSCVGSAHPKRVAVRRERRNPPGVGRVETQNSKLRTQNCSVRSNQSFLRTNRT